MNKIALDVDVSDGIDGQMADILFLIISVLVKRAGGAVSATWDELNEADEQFDTAFDRNGVTISLIPEKVQ